MQWILEHVYIYTGLPWWASLGVVAVLIRAFMFVPALQANDTTQRMQDLRKDVRYSLAQEKLRNAVMNTRDQHAMMTAQREVRMIERANGVRQWKLFVPLIQVPITIGAFRLLRGMAALPVPSLESGGLWWFSDLTVADPYFALPILSSAFLYGIMRVGFFLPLFIVFLSFSLSLCLFSLLSSPPFLSFVISPLFSLSSFLPFFLFYFNACHTLLRSFPKDRKC